MAFIFKKGTFGTGGPTRVRPTVSTFVPRPLVDTSLYIGLEDDIQWLLTENNDPLIIE
jgi:hypothetical protein